MADDEVEFTGDPLGEILQLLGYRPALSPERRAALKAFLNQFPVVPVSDGGGTGPGGDPPVEEPPDGGGTGPGGDPPVEEPPEIKGDSAGEVVETDAGVSVLPPTGGADPPVELPANFQWGVDLGGTLVLDPPPPPPTGGGDPYRGINSLVEDILRQNDPTYAPAGPTPSPAPRPKRLLIAAGIAVLGIAAIGVAVGGRRSETNPPTTVRPVAASLAVTGVPSGGLAAPSAPSPTSASAAGATGCAGFSAARGANFAVQVSFTCTDSANSASGQPVTLTATTPSVFPTPGGNWGYGSSGGYAPACVPSPSDAHVEVCSNPTGFATGPNVVRWTVASDQNGTPPGNTCGLTINVVVGVGPKSTVVGSATGLTVSCP